MRAAGCGVRGDHGDGCGNPGVVIKHINGDVWGVSHRQSCYFNRGGGGYSARLLDRGYAHRGMPSVSPSHHDAARFDFLRSVDMLLLVCVFGFRFSSGNRCSAPRRQQAGPDSVTGSVGRACHQYHSKMQHGWFSQIRLHFVLWALFVGFRLSGFKLLVLPVVDRTPRGAWCTVFALTRICILS